jgi:signal transduction histidine kinase
MRWWPQDLAAGLRQALGSPGVPAIRDLLAATLAPGESGAVFTHAGAEPRVLAAFPADEPFQRSWVRRLAGEVFQASGRERDSGPATDEPAVRPSREGPSAWATAIAAGGEVRAVLVLLAPDGADVSEESRERAAVLAPVLGLIGEVAAARARAGDAEGQVAQARQMLRLTKPGRDVHEISQAILDFGVRLVEADSAALWLRLRWRLDLELHAARGPLGRRGARRRLAAADVAPLMGTAPLSCPPFPLTLPRDLLRDDAVQAAVLVPIHHDDELVGLLAAGRLDGARDFGGDDSERLVELAELATVLIVNVCLREEVQERSRQSRASRRIAKAVAASLSLDEVFRVALRELRRTAAFDAAALVMLDEAGDRGEVLVAEVGKPPRRIAWVPEWRDSAAGLAIRTRRAAITPAFGAANRPAPPFLQDLPGVRATVTVPLPAAREPIGALTLASRTRGRFRRRDVRRLRPIAEQLALAVRQARLVRAATAGREDRLRLQGRLARAERQATVGRLAGALAHEIRNPLTVIGTTVQYLRDRLPAEHEHRVLLEAADRKVREMDESLEVVLSLARPLDLQPRPVDVGGLLTDVAGFVRARAGRQGVDLAIEAEAGLAPVMVDRRLMERALLNLGLNALDAMPSGGRLTFAARTVPESGIVLLTVADTGAATGDADPNAVFELSYASKRRGATLGLAITRRIVEEHGGAIEATSVPGRGTTIVVALSAAATPRPEGGHG